MNDTNHMKSIDDYMGQKTSVARILQYVIRREIKQPNCRKTRKEAEKQTTNDEKRVNFLLTSKICHYIIIIKCYIANCVCVRVQAFQDTNRYKHRKLYRPPKIRANFQFYNIPNITYVVFLSPSGGTN